MKKNTNYMIQNIVRSQHKNSFSPKGQDVSDYLRKKHSCIFSPFTTFLFSNFSIINTPIDNQKKILFFKKVNTYSLVTFISSHNTVKCHKSLSLLAEWYGSWLWRWLWMDEGRGGAVKPRSGQGGTDWLGRVRDQQANWSAKERGIVEPGKTLTAQRRSI